jgi:hypothetical protein
MKTIVKGKKVQVNYELGSKSNGEPIINENYEDLGEVEIITLDNDVSFNKGEEIYFDESTSAKVKSIKKTLDGTTYVYTDRKIKESDSEEYELIKKMYDKAYELYAKNLLKKYPNIANLLKIMGKKNLSSQETVEAIKSFNGVQNDFFTR